MKLLEIYLRAVKMYLPREQKDDIINELSENLFSKMEETEAELGRPLTEPEQETILREHGDPMVVASRYGATHRCVSFGRQLIGPALFPIYIMVLCVHWGFTILLHAFMAIFRDPLGIGAFLVAVSCQFVAVTLLFIILDIYHRNLWQFRRFYVGYLHPIPRAPLAIGLVFWIIYSSLWAVIPYSSMISGVFDHFEIAPAWQILYLPILLLLLAGVVQRAVNLIRPDWNWLPSVVRLIVNIMSLFMLYFLPANYSYEFLVDVMRTTPVLEHPATISNGAIRYVLISSFSVYRSI